ncbi:hypothetical protein H2203_004779 [Taxawa tesnikishii (nom. ined.)]|nr:hypothetical protein H2203_004779 [Dothideales sp. JES 119]
MVALTNPAGRDHYGQYTQQATTSSSCPPESGKDNTAASHPSAGPHTSPPSNQGDTFTRALEPLRFARACREAGVSVSKAGWTDVRYGLDY